MIGRDLAKSPFMAAWLVIVVVGATAKQSSGTQASSAATRTEAETVVVKVGFVANESEMTEYLNRNRLRFEQLDLLCQELHSADPSFPQFHFRIAYGGYNDLYFWAKRGLIDLGIFSPGVYAAILREGGKQGFPNWECFSIENFDNMVQNPTYGSRCIVNASCPVRTGKELADAIKLGVNIDLLFADPLSLSGFIAPVHVLAQSGLGVDRAAFEPVSRFVFSHDRALRMVDQANGTKRTVAAFVREQEIGSKTYRGLFGSDPPQTPEDMTDHFRVLDFPELHLLELQHSAIACSDKFEYGQALRRLLDESAKRSGAWLTPVGTLSQNESGIVGFNTVKQWLSDPSKYLMYTSPEFEFVSLDEMGYLLQDYQKNSQDRRPMRIALCLSGGGAKCAYQVGAACAIEDKLADLRARVQHDRLGDANGLDISLVVGTSGGAVNAVPIAMGLTRPSDKWGLEQLKPPAASLPRTASTLETIPTWRANSFLEGQLNLVDAWRQLHKWTILSPWPLTEWLMSIWLSAGIVVGLLILGFIVGCLPEDLRKKADKFPWMSLASLLVATACFLVGFSKYNWNQPVIVWLDAAFWIKSGMLVLLLGVGIFVVYGWIWNKGNPGLSDAKFVSLPMLTWALATQVILSVFLAREAFFVQPSLFTSQGIETEVATAFEFLLSKQIGSSDVPFTPGPSDSVVQRLKAIEDRICRPDASLLIRDLVITASNVHHERDVPSNFYSFINARANGPPPPSASNWIDLSDIAAHSDSHLLLDVVIGSGSIFPMFPARHLDSLFPGHDVALIDGGFAHNSPLEAALQWNATHIIQIEASPDQDEPGDSLSDNIGVGFDHLFSQAQLADTEARENTRSIVFTIRPKRSITLVDFDPDKTFGAACQGFVDAMGGVPDGFLEGGQVAIQAQGLRAFQRQPALPEFIEIHPSNP